MWNRISLRSRIYIILAALVFLTALGGLIQVWYTYRVQGVLDDIIDKDIAAFQSAEALEHALVNQKGFVSYYFMDADPEWLRKLGEYRQIFKQKLSEGLARSDTPLQKQAVNQINDEYQSYIEEKDRVIAYYMAGNKAEGLRLHEKVRKRYFKILELCEAYKDFHRRKILIAQDKSRIQATDLRLIAGGSVVLVVFLGILLAVILAGQILNPLHRLVQETGQGKIIKRPEDEIKALSQSIHGLIEDAGQAHLELTRSREHLVLAEKMAMVGKLAAGVAHSIRNPLTSVKMRLFSLHRSLELNDYQKEDFQVITEEIRHTDTIVQNFLEFARPPKLKMQTMSPSTVVDQTLQLLEHRLKSYDVSVQVHRKQPLPEIQGDPEQLKEVFVNLIENACEAMEPGGLIVIEEETPLRLPIRMVRIRITDNGNGISEAMQKRLFEPFFTTKEEGTGLGLSIANRIVQEHGGRLEVASKEGQGTTFTITLPLKESGHEQNSNH